jgi:hypothetical protein
MKAKDKVYDAAENLKPYVERAMADEQLRDDVMRAFGTAREIYKDLIGEKSAVTLASRVATDDEIRNKLRDAIEDLRHASDRLQGRQDRSSRNRTLLVAGIALGILFNPVTGPETRRFIRDMLSSGDQDRDASSTNGSGR